MRQSDKLIKILNKRYNIKGVDIAIVAGSGLLTAIPEMQDVKKIYYSELGLPKSKVPGHSGCFIFGKINGKNVAVVSRIHYYEYGDVNLVRLPYEIVAGLGVKTALIMTSAGGVNKDFKVGDIMLIKDHINLSGANPMVGMEQTRFIDMNNCYDRECMGIIKKIAIENKIDLKDGVFCQMSGPNYETKAEIEMLRGFGVSAVSMSTVHDCIICNYLDMKVIGMAVIVNICEEDNSLSHDEVLKNASIACEKIKTILSEFL